jgi:hypothetical protein
MFPLNGCPSQIRRSIETWLLSHSCFIRVLRVFSGFKVRNHEITLNARTPPQKSFIGINARPRRAEELLRNYWLLNRYAARFRLNNQKLSLLSQRSLTAGKEVTVCMLPHDLARYGRPVCRTQYTKIRKAPLGTSCHAVARKVEDISTISKERLFPVNQA